MSPYREDTEYGDLSVPRKEVNDICNDEKHLYRVIILLLHKQNLLNLISNNVLLYYVDR